MYSFEGEYYRKPTQSLGGVSQTPARETLLQRAREEREKRQEQRNRVNAAVTIQAAVRGYLQYNHERTKTRDAYDQQEKNLLGKQLGINELQSLTKKLLFFYNNKNHSDVQRLIRLSQHFLTLKSDVIGSITSPPCIWTHRLKRLLHLHIKHMTNTTDSIAICLRVVEVFTDEQFLSKHLTPDRTQDLLLQIFQYLIHRGYYESICNVLNTRVPPVIQKSATPPTPLAELIFTLTTRVINVTTSHEIRFTVLHNLCASMLCSLHSEQISCFLLPALSEWEEFPFAQMLMSITDEKNKLCVPSTIYLLYSILSLGRRHVGMNSEMTSHHFILVLGALLPQVTSENATHLFQHDGMTDDAEDSDEENMDTSEDREVSLETKMYYECLELINEESMVHWIVHATTDDPDVALLRALSSVAHSLLITHKLAIHKFRLLYTLSFRGSFLDALWSYLSSLPRQSPSLFPCASSATLLQALAEGLPLTTDDRDAVLPPLALFCALFSHLIVTLDEEEFYGERKVNTMPFSLITLMWMSRIIRDICVGLVELAFPDTRHTISMPFIRNKEDASKESKENTQIWSHLLRVCVNLVRQLHNRDTRRRFCPEGHWTSSKVFFPYDQPSEFSRKRKRLREYRPFRFYMHSRKELEEEGPPLSTQEIRLLTLLRELPFVFPFPQRVQVLQQMIVGDRQQNQSEMTNFLRGPMIQLLVRRNYLYEDAFDKLSPENEPNLKLKIRVQLVNAAGLDEAGVDGGGLFREFLNELIRTGFDPNRGFFKLTRDNLLYPNPSVNLLVEDFPKHYFFLGRLLGKALYENMLVELPLADFFLAKLVGHGSSNVDVHHLASLDQVMYKNLLSLKSLEGDDIAELGLDFSIVNEELGETRVEELKAGGASIPVTYSNRIEYIHLMADYKLNRQIRAQCIAFRQGLSDVISLEWLHMFSCKEVQVLISGAFVPIDVDDMKLNCIYSGRYTEDHPTIRLFWKIVESLDDEHRRALLKFVTSCSRPPLLGFKELYPPFCIQSTSQGDRLPTASTCMNLLKLPEFVDEHILRSKLLYAIESGSGFELS